MSTEPTSTEGFFWCGRCKKVVTLSEQQVEAALSMPAGVIRDEKCPVCHHHEVRWKEATPERPRTDDGRLIHPPLPPVDPERAKELFQKVRAGLTNE